MAKKPKKSKPARTKKPATKKTPTEQGSALKDAIEEPKPEFEQAMQDLHEDYSHSPAAEPEKKVERRGGPRPGSGRPKGSTEEFAAVNRLPERANATLIPVLQIPFATWAKAIGVKEMALNKDEAKDLALPVTQLLEFYFPGRIPEIAWVWLMMLGTTYRILEPRLDLLAAKRKAIASEQGPSVATGGKTGPASPPGRSQTGAAEPATGFPQDKPKKR